MILRVKTPENVLVTGPDSLGQVGTEFNPLALVRGLEPIQLQFVQTVDGVETPYRQAADTVITLGFKVRGVFEGDWLISATDIDFTRPGADDGFYTANLDCDTTEARTLLLTPDGNTANDVASAAIAGELSWLVATDSIRQRTRTIYATLLNTYTQGDEGDPTGANPARNAFFSPTIVNYTGGGSTKLDGIPTLTLEVPQLVFFIHGTTNDLQAYKLVNGTSFESVPQIIHPDDYDGTLNTKIWKRALSAPAQGVAQLSSGTATVSETSVTADSRIFLTAQDDDTLGILHVYDRTVGTSFVIHSSSGSDSGYVAWMILEPLP